MSRQHIKNYFQKYYLILGFATSAFIINACSSIRKVPKGEYLLTQNQIIYEDGKVLNDDLAEHIRQKPNQKFLFLFPLGLWTYNLANPKYDTILTEYMTYSNEMKNQNLRDSLYVKYNHPEYKGQSIFINRVFHKLGQPPVIFNPQKTEQSTSNIQKRLVYKGYWDAKVKNKEILNSTTQKAKVKYFITHNEPTYIKEYKYNIPDEEVKNIYENHLKKSELKVGEILDQTKLEKEVQRITSLMEKHGYYRFNQTNRDIYFTADTLISRKQVPITIDIHKNSINHAYKKSTFGKIEVAVVKNQKQRNNETFKDSTKGIDFYKMDNQYKTKALWRAITLEPDKIYNQRDLDLSKTHLLSMDNFQVSYEDNLRGLTAPNDSIIDVKYLLSPLPKYETKYGLDLTYSQILNFGFFPSFDLTTRNLFGGAENLYTGVSSRFGFFKNPKNKNILAYELSANASLRFPRFLSPFNTDEILRKRYSTSTSINLGVSLQKNIGLGRFNINTGLEYNINVSDKIQHKITLFNTDLSLTNDKDKYYDFFTSEREIRNNLFQLYSTSLYNDFNNGLITSDQLSLTILEDTTFINNLNGKKLDLYNDFQQSLINKVRQTQDVLISSFIYDFTYNELGNKNIENPFFFNAKVEVAGNTFSFLRPKSTKQELTTGKQKTILNIPFSQFVKFDFDLRKYFKFGRKTLALRQFIGLGIPYGNSNSMPFIRSYFNGGASDIRAWRPFGGLGPADSQLNEKVRAYLMDNVKLTTNIEYRIPLNSLFEGAFFTDIGNIWSLKDNGLDDEFKLNKFYKQVGIGSGFGIRINIMNIIGRMDIAYKIYNPNANTGEKWQFNNFKIFKPRLNLAIGYPF